MANYSNASGVLTFTVKVTEHELRYLVRTILDKTKTWKYCTYVDENDINNMKVLEIEDGVFQTILDFDGDGRWAYECNVTSMLPTLARILPRSEIERLEDIDFVINFNYADEESGCSVLYTQEEELRHPRGRVLEETTNVLLSSQSYDYTPENLREIFGYDDFSNSEVG